MPGSILKITAYLFIAALALVSIEAFAHGVDDKTRAFLLQNEGIKIAWEFAESGQLDHLHIEKSKYLEMSWSRMK